MTKKELQKVKELYERKEWLYKSFDKEGREQQAQEYINDMIAIQLLMQHLGYELNLKNEFVKETK